MVEHCTCNAKVVGSNPVQSLDIFQVIFPVVSWLHSHLSFFHLIATVGHLLPWNSYTSAEYYVHWIYRAELTHDRSHVALIAQLVEHCTGNAMVVGSNPVLFQVNFPVVSWLHSHLSFLQWEISSVTLWPPCWCSSEGQQHGVCIQSSINLGETLFRSSWRKSVRARSPWGN